MHYAFLSQNKALYSCNPSYKDLSGAHLVLYLVTLWCRFLYYLTNQRDSTVAVTQVQEYLPAQSEPALSEQCIYFSVPSRIQ